METRFEVLGPVRVVRGGQEVGPISDLRRRLLAVLLVRAGRPVPTDLLAGALWREETPQWPGKSLQVHAHRLRQVLDGPDRLLSVPGGYQLSVGPDELDAIRFERLHDEARQAATSGECDRAVALFREALALWRGAPYAGIDETGVVAQEAKRLAEARLIAYEELFDAELARGRARDVVPELTELVTEYPLRERFVGLQMLALYRSGRRTRAEVAYRALRQRLSKELRTEPGRELRALHEAIRTEDASLEHEPPSVAPPSPGRGEQVRPGQLPAAPGAFFGREAELEELERITAPDADGALVVLTGMAGVGKTGLALRYAHRVADRYGDGQLYIDLGGHATGPALDPMVALGRLLRGLGADARRGWESVADASAEYRSLVAGRKLLVLLDNAASAEQVRPLLPATDGCLTLVTSRRRLSGLIAREGAARIVVGELASEPASALLAQLAGKDRIGREPEAAAALVEACGGLPLALRIAAAQLADEPHRPLSDYLAELREHGPATLALDGDKSFTVTAAFDLSYERLDTATQQLYRRLGVVPGLDFTVDAVAALTGTTSSTTRRAIRKLIDAHLLQEHAPGRYRFHDLLRDDARRRSETEDSSTARDDALERLLAWYYQGKRAAIAVRTSILRHPPAPELPDGIPGITFGEGRDATLWLRAEIPNIAAAVRVAARLSGRTHWAWQLTVGLLAVMADQGFIADAQEMAETAITVARAADDHLAIANVEAELIAARHRFDLPVDTSQITEALQQAERSANRPLLAYALNVAAVVHLGHGDLADAEQYATRSLAIHRSDGDTASQARALGNLGLIAARGGELRLAESRFMAVLDLAGTTNGRPAALALPEVLRIRVMLGRVDGIDELIDRAVDAVERSGDHANIHKLRLVRSSHYRDTGRLAEAVEQATAARDLAQDIGQPWTLGDAHYHLGLCLLTDRDVQQAREQFGRAAEFADLAGRTVTLASAVRGLAEAELLAGRLPEAASRATEAVGIARSRQAGRVCIAHTVLTLGRVELARGRPHEAIDCGTQALALHDETGHFLGRARAHRLLGTAKHAIGPRSGDEHLREALSMFETYGSPEAIDVRRALASR